MLPQLRARRQLEAIEAATAPYMDADTYRSVVRRLNDEFGVTAAKATPATVADLASIGIDVEFVPKEVTPDE